MWKDDRLLDDSGNRMLAPLRYVSLLFLCFLFFLSFFPFVPTPFVFGTHPWGNSLVTHCLYISMGFWCQNGGYPVKNSYIRIPNAHQSTAVV